MQDVRIKSADRHHRTNLPAQRSAPDLTRQSGKNSFFGTVKNNPILAQLRENKIHKRTKLGHRFVCQSFLQSLMFPQHLGQWIPFFKSSNREKPPHTEVGFEQTRPRMWAAFRLQLPQTFPATPFLRQLLHWNAAPNTCD